jgi:NAD(P)-dependent dehydrogenase (short-subunit alcohol dehydrogenase family)
MFRPFICTLSGLLIALVCIAANECRSVLITGGTKGIGHACAKLLVEKPEWDVHCAGRSTASIPTRFNNYNYLPLDLCDLDSIKKLAVDWGAKPLDVLVLNAGVQRTKLTRSAQGIETTLATNHIGNFYLMKLLLPVLKKSKRGRIVIVGSGGKHCDTAVHFRA